MHLRVSGGTAGRVGFQVSVHVCANYLDVGGTTVWMAGVGFGVMVSFCLFLLLANLGTWRKLYGIRWGRDKGMKECKSETIRIRKIPRYESMSCHLHPATFFSCVDEAVV